MDRARLKVIEESAGKAPVCRMEEWWKSRREGEDSDDNDGDDSGPNRNGDKVSVSGLFAVYSAYRFSRYLGS